MNYLDELNFYDEKMLRLQYEISECFTHQLTKGEVREEFIKDYIKKKIRDIKILKGSIFKADEISSQLDMIMCNNEVIYNQFGSHYLIDAKFCKQVFEIKSKLTNEYLEEFSVVSKKIKNMNANIKTGIFSYSLKSTQKNILKNFGYKYDEELEMYDYNVEKIKKEYKNIDYVMCIDENHEFVLINEEDEFKLYKDIPIIKYLWPILRK